MKEKWKDVCKYGNIEEIIQLLDNSIELNIKTYFNYGLIGACERGDLNIVNLIIEKGSKLQVQFGWGRGLIASFYGGNIDIVKLMLDKGALPSRDELYLSTLSNNIEIVKLIIEKKRFDDYYLQDNLKDALRGACKIGNIDIVKLIIDMGAKNWNSGLYFACMKGHLDIVKLLLEKGADPHQLYAACKGGNQSIVDLIIESVTKPDWNRGLQGACRGGHLNIAKQMISKSQISFNWSKALENACESGNLDIVQLIIKNGKNLNWTMGLNGALKNYYHTENEKKDPTIVNLMFTKGVNIKELEELYFPDCCCPKYYMFVLDNIYGLIHVNRNNVMKYITVQSTSLDDYIFALEIIENERIKCSNNSVSTIRNQ